MPVPPNWQLLYNKVRADNDVLRRRLAPAPRTSAELTYTMAALKTFMESMTVAQGAVTCSTLYDDTFFERDGDPQFKKLLCSTLVAYYAASQNLIERSYDSWKANA